MAAGDDFKSGREVGLQNEMLQYCLLSAAHASIMKVKN
jgi:hypothetical protein